MGVQSLVFYCFVAWLPTILQSKGISVESAGYYASAYQFIGIPATFATPIIAGRKKSQRKLATYISIFYLVGMILFAFGKGSALLLAAVLICGFCSGACISLAMSMIGFRTGNAEEAAQLSGMSQTIGYALAAVGPFIMGWIFDGLGNWSAPIFLLAIMILVLIWAGWNAGRNCHV